MDYKDTLLLPSTTFPMRGNLPNNEPKRYKRWEEKSVYKKMHAKKGGGGFNLHDGPPYANGHTHIGHALNKILKDIIVKHHYFSGKDISYTPGWDCHGLPIEHKVEEKIGSSKKESMEKTKIRELCREHAARFIDIQREEFKTLGVLGDWDNPYKTMDYRFEADIYRSLCKIAQKGLLIERSKPVYWSWACKTALAEAEVEYESKNSDSIFVAFSLDAAALKSIGAEKAALIIWTTTPWTLPANSGIALHPEEGYLLSEDGHIIAKDLYENLKEKEVIKGGIIKEIAPTELEGKNAINPLNGRNSKIILGEHVSLEDGSGAVHTAPGHGEDDYRVGLRYGLDVIMPVSDTGCYDESVEKMGLLPDAKEFVGMHVFKANKLILELLGDALLKHDVITHSYPHCWRSHKPIIFRATKQWFIQLDKKIEGEGQTLREIALQSLEGVKFYPEHGRKRLTSMIENRPDWCISRQRDWGVPIAFFRDKGTKEVIFDQDVLENIADIFEKEGADAWWSKEIAQLLPEGSSYNPDSLEKVYDILDVWFDSGSTWAAVLESEHFEAGEYPASMYLEGSDQHRGWFQSSLLVSCAINHKPPYRSILTHGFTVDEKGEKMSKSKGNVIAPSSVLKESGGEILRLWVAMSDYQSDLKISKNILKQISEQYRKIRNTIRFLLANTEGLDALSDDFGTFDRWILGRSKEVFGRVQANFDAYEFSKGMHLLSRFIVTELSGYYMDMCKDKLYCNAKDDPARVASVSAMAIIARSLLSLIAPILTHTADEAIEHAPAIIKEEGGDIFDLRYKEIPEVDSSFDAEFFTESKEKLNEIMDALKKEKRIKSSLELMLYSDSEKFAKVDNLDEWYIVSMIVPKEDSSLEELGSFALEGARFVLYRSNMDKCPRCWKINAHDGNLCSRCAAVV